MKKVLVITGSPADWGWLEALIEQLGQFVDAHIVDIGNHVNATKHTDKLHTWTSEKPQSTYDFVRIAVSDFGAWLENTVDTYSAAVVLGDRAEVLASALLLQIKRIPVHHLFAGDTSGCIDDYLRDAISALSTHLYAATSPSLKRCVILKKLFSAVRSAHLVSYPFSIDYSILNELGLEENQYAIARFHPETVVMTEPYDRWIGELCFRAERSHLKCLIVFPPNKDTGYEEIEKAWTKAEERLTRKGIRFRILGSVSRPCYLGLLRKAKWIAGNSSSFVLEAPLVGNHNTALYGNRQRSRARLDSEGAIPVVKALIQNIYTSKSC